MDAIRLESMGAGAGARFVGDERSKLRHLAIPTGGAVDPVAYRAALALTGLPPGTPIIEIPLRGGDWLLTGPCEFAFTGADFTWTVGGRPAAMNRLIYHERKLQTRISGSFSRFGQYGYLAIRGRWVDDRPAGWLAQQTHKLIEAEEQLTFTPLLTAAPPKSDSTCPPPAQLNSISTDSCLELTLMPGPEWSVVNSESSTSFLSHPHKILPNSNRQGLRLQSLGSPPADWGKLGSMISSPVLPGTVQVTPAGPIILGPDAQTIGGYPRIGALSRKDLARVYQHRLGGQIQFTGG